MPTFLGVIRHVTIVAVLQDTGNHCSIPKTLVTVLLLRLFIYFQGIFLYFFVFFVLSGHLQASNSIANEIDCLALVDAIVEAMGNEDKELLKAADVALNTMIETVNTLCEGLELVK